MKSGFKDRTAIKKQAPSDHPKDGKNTPWDFRAPQYDQRSSCFVGAGTHYGVAHNQPVGHHGDPIERVPCMPFGRVTTMKVKEIG